MLKRLSKFYTYGLKIDPNQDFLEPRKEPDYANPNTTPLAR